MKKKKAALILAALIAMTTVSAQAAITPEEQEQIVTAVLEKLENEKKTPHYVSVSSTETGTDSNVMNDGALAKNSIAIGPSVKTEGKDNIVIGSGEIEGQKGVTSVNGDRVVVVGHGNYFQPVSDRNGKPVSYRDSAIIGHNNKLLQGDEHDAGGGTPAYQIIHGGKNTLKGSFTGAIGYENEIKNSSRPGHTSQSMAFAVGTENTIDATGYYMGDKNRVNTLADYKEPGENPNVVGADLYVVGRHNIIGSSKGGEWYVDSGRIFGSENVVYTGDANVFGWSNKVYGGAGAMAIGHGNKVGIDESGQLVKNDKNQAIYNPVAVGNSNTVTGNYGVAVGSSAISQGVETVAVGSKTQALSDYSSAVGSNNKAKGYGSVAIGSLNNKYDFEANKGKGDWKDFDSGEYANAMGVMNISTGEASSAVGTKNKASGENASSFGFLNTAAGKKSSAVGYWNKAEGESSSSFGYLNTATGKQSSAVGFRNYATGENSAAIGIYNNKYNVVEKKWEDQTAGKYSVAIGSKNHSAGNHSSALGYENKSGGLSASAVGYRNITDGQSTSAFGYANQATGAYSFASGTSNQAKGQYSSAVGNSNEAEGRRSQAVGYRNFVSGYGSVAIGSENNLNFVKQYQAIGFVQTGDLSSALGISNVTAGRNSSGLGNGNYAFGTKSVGVGMSNYAMGYESLAIGHYSVAGEEDVNQIDRVKRSAAIGSRAKSAITDAVAIGSFSNATRDKGSYGYHPGLGKAAMEADITKDANIGAYRTALETARTEWENSVVAAEKVLHKIHTQQYTSQGEYQQLATEYEKLNAESDTKRKVYDEAQKKVSDLVGAWQGQLAALSVGDETSGRTRQITGVAAGSADTDAVNVAQLKALDQKIGESGVKYYGVNETVVPDIELGWAHLVIYDGKKELNADLAGKNIHGEGAQKNKGNGSMNANYGSMAAGYNAYTSHGFSTALGNETVAYEKSMAAGFASYARAESVALGVNAFAKDRSEAIGQYARADQEAIAIGYKATAGGFNKGEQTDKIPQAMTGIAIGKEAYAKGGMAFGNGAESLSLNAMAFGVRAKATGSGIALGYQAQANVSGGIAIGMNSRAEVGRGIKGYLAPGDIDNQTDAEQKAWISGGSAVSFGNIKMARQLTNVAAGLADTDAVNVAQLKALNDKVDKSGVHYFSATSKKQEAGSNFANDGAKADDSIVVGISSTSNGVNSTVLGNNNTLTAKTGSRNNSIVVGQSIEVEGDQNAVFATEYQNNLDRRLTKVAGTRNTVVGIGNLAGYTAERDPNDRNKWIYTKWKDGLSSENVVFGLNNTANGGSIVVGSDSEVFGLGTSVGYHNKIIGDEDYGIALGNNLVVKGEQSIAIGSASETKAEYATAIGQEAMAEKAYSMAFGSSAKAENNYSVAIGAFADAKSRSGVAIGSSSLSDREKGIKGYLAGKDDESEIWKSTRGAVSVGNKEKKYTRQIIGVAAGSEDTDAVNVAQLKVVNDKADKLDKKINSEKTHYFSVSATSRDNRSNYNNNATDGFQNALAIGENVVANDSSIAIGYGAKNNSDVKIGPNGESVRQTHYYNVLYLGNEIDSERFKGEWAYAKMRGSHAVAIGDNAMTNDTMGIAIGYKASAGKLGANTAVSPQIAIGALAEASGWSSVAVGEGATAETNSSIAIGNGAYTKATRSGDIYSIAIGTLSRSTATESIAFGRRAKATADRALALGVAAEARVESGVALGFGSVADRAHSLTPYLAKEGNVGNTVYGSLGAVSIGNGDGNRTYDNMGQVWDAEKATRQLTNLAAGSEDTDAVNVAQLKVVNDKADKNKTDITNLTNTVNNITQGTTDVSSWKLQANGANERTIKKDSVVNFKNGENTEVTVNENDITVDLNAATKKQINDNTTNINNIDKRVTTIENNIDQKIEGAKIKVEGDTDTGVKVKEDKGADGKVTGYKVSLDNKVKVGNVTIDGTGEGADSKGEITGLTNRTLDSGDFATKGRAATEEQLKAAMDQAVAQGTTTVKAGDQNISVVKTGNKNEYTVSLAEDISVNRVTANEYKVGDKTYINDKGVNANGNKVTNVADGVVSKDSKDAVNGSQLYGVEQKVNQNTTNITNLQNNIYDMGTRVGELDNRMNKVGAGAAALAALHPQDFDPDDKWDIAAGVGNYKNATAAAVGLFYRPNERTMLNLGWTMGDSRNMVNAGVSVKLGSGNEYMKLSRAEMAQKLEEQNKEIREMKDKDRERDAQMQEVMKQLELLRKQVEK